MDQSKLAGLLADQRRMRVLAAIALDAGSDAAIASMTGLGPREVYAARRRLEEHGLVTAVDGRVTVAYAALQELAAAVKPVADVATTGDPQTAPFLDGDRLRSLPAQKTRRIAVLTHIARVSFDADRFYDEPAVNERLRRWCDGSEVDHAALRRYLVVADLLRRAEGRYWLAPA